MSGLEARDLLKVEWSASDFQPCHYVALDRKARRIVIAVRGSLEVSDLYTDVAAAPVAWEFNGVRGFVHEGLLSAATYVHASTAEALAEATRRHPGWPVLLTGARDRAGVVFGRGVGRRGCAAGGVDGIHSQRSARSSSARRPPPPNTKPAQPHPPPRHPPPTHRRPPARPLAGHSLGGGVAALVTLLLLRPGGAPPGVSDVRCVALGPAATLSESLTEVCEDYVTSVVHGTDPVPRLRCVGLRGWEAPGEGRGGGVQGIRGIRGGSGSVRFFLECSTAVPCCAMLCWQAPTSSSPHLPASPTPSPPHHPRRASAAATASSASSSTWSAPPSPAACPTWQAPRPLRPPTRSLIWAPPWRAWHARGWGCRPAGRRL